MIGRAARTGSARTRRAVARAYTAVEVMMGITLLSIGAAAVIAMQRGAIQSNLDARKIDMANAIAREWIDRLRRDSTKWTLPSSVNPGGDNYASAALLKQHLDLNTNGDTKWHYPDAYLAALPATSPPDGVSPGFDILGRDLTVADIKGTSSKPSSAIFCVNVRTDWLVQNKLIRAEVRVVWKRDLYLNPSDLPTVDWCNDTTASDATAITGNTNHYHFVYAATAIRKNPSQ